MSSLSVTEKDTTGKPTRTYILTTTPVTESAAASTRLDVVQSFKLDHFTSPRILLSPWTLLRQLSSYLMPLFLPYGYPHTVTADYTPYQIYDSLQAFASTIAGLLSSRAVLQSLGLDSDNATSTATYATLLSIAQATIANLSTILFAHRASNRISAEVKYYRFFADIANDTAFILDCLSPSLPQVLRVPALCLSSACRAICGVCGSSKAVLSAHFALNDNIGELNAKDGSQETVVNLVGMWVGGVVVSRVESVWATWAWMLTLLGLHLWFNYCAVRSIRLKTLNPYRAGLVISETIRTGRCPSIDQIGQEESIFEKGGILCGQDGQLIAEVTMGMGLADFAKSLGNIRRAGSGSVSADNDLLDKLFSIFQNEQYLIWYDAPTHSAIIALKEHATIEDQFKAWCHAFHLGRAIADGEPLTDVLAKVKKTLGANEHIWVTTRNHMAEAGWRISASVLEATPGTRLCIG